MPHSLFDDFKETGYHSSLISTFSLDPAFYDTSLQVRMRSQGCLNNLLFADSSKLDQAIELLPDAFQYAGSKYLLAPVQSRGCFHPKLALRYGKNKARLIIGSANATSAGWAGNLELVSTISWSKREKSPDDEIMRSLIARSHYWLWEQVDSVGDENLAYKLALIQSQSPWLEKETDLVSEPFQLDDGSSVDLLLSTPGQSNGLGERMQALVDEPIERLTVISPYWDENLSALKSMAQDIPEVHIMLAQNKTALARTSTFPVGQLDGLNAAFHSISEEQDNYSRFLHAKLFLYRGITHEFLFLGSANCTTAALGISGRSGINHEALLYRKLPAGSVDEILRLNYKTNIDPKLIQTPPDEPANSTMKVTLAGGNIKQNHTRLVWTPPDSFPGGPEAIIVGDSVFPLARYSNGHWQADIGECNLTSNIARIRLLDGRTSRPVIIANRDELRRFAPFPVGDSIRRKLEAVVNGDADLINLAKDIHLLLSDDQPSTKALERLKRTSEGKSGATIAGCDFDSPEDFRKALELQASIKAVGLHHSDNPALQVLLQIVLRGMVSFEEAEAVDNRDAVLVNSLAEGEDQDDLGFSDKEQSDHSSESPTDLSIPQIVSKSEFELNQAALRRGIKQFHDFLLTAKSSSQDLDMNFVTRSLFMFYLMLHGCSKHYQIEGKRTEVLMPFGYRGDVSKHETFVFTAARAISMIWGPNFAKSLIRRVRWSEHLKTLPIQITTLTIISRWVLAAILTEVRIDQSNESLKPILEVQVPTLFAATKVFPELNDEESTAMIGQMENNMGMATTVRRQIGRTLRELQAGGSGKLPY